MADELSMINLNVNMTMANTGNVSSTQMVGQAGQLGQGVAAGESSSVRNMEELAASMTAAGSSNAGQGIMANLDASSLDNGAGKIGDFMANTDIAASYFEGQESAGLESAPLTAQTANAQGVASVAGKAGNIGNTGAGANGAGVENNASQLSNYVDSYCGDMSAGAKSDLVNYYAQGAKQGSAASAQGTLNATDGKTPADQMAAQAAAASNTVQSMGKPDGAPKAMAQNNVQAAKANAAKNANMAETTASANAKAENAKVAAKAETAKAQSARTESAKEAKATKEAESKETAKKEATEKEIAQEEAAQEDAATEKANKSKASQQNSSSSGDMTSVLTQYLQQNTSLNATQINALVNDYTSQYSSVTDMNSLFTQLDSDATKMANGTYQSKNYNAAEEGGVNAFSSKLDMVGSTAMSTNMANLEELVNMDLMSKFESGFSVES